MTWLLVFTSQSAMFFWNVIGEFNRDIMFDRVIISGVKSI